MALGQILRHYRQQRGLKLEQLAELAQVEVGTISALELRDSTRSKYAPQLAHALGVPLEVLLGAAAPAPPPPAAHHAASAPIPIRPPTAGELPASYAAWPFDDVTRKQYYTDLTPEDRAEVVGFVKGLLKRRRVDKRKSNGR